MTFEIQGVEILDTNSSNEAADFSELRAALRIVQLDAFKFDPLWRDGGVKGFDFDTNSVIRKVVFDLICQVPIGEAEAISKKRNEREAQGNQDHAHYNNNPISSGEIPAPFAQWSPRLRLLVWKILAVVYT